MERRYFEFVYAEVCVAVERRLSRYDLWLLLSDAPMDRNRLSGDEARVFVDRILNRLPRRDNEVLTPRARKRLLRRLTTFDSRHPTPEEWLTKLVDSSA
jgi:hypothetical protein